MMVAYFLGLLAPLEVS